MIFKNFFFFAGIIFLIFCSVTIAKEITIFNSSGDPTAYVDTSDDLTIYLWAGEPVAYINDVNVRAFTPLDN